MEIKLSTDKHPILQQPYRWGPVSSIFTESIPEPSSISNVHVVPFVGDNCVLLHTTQSGWAMPGGTLQEGEDAATTLYRELTEELGARIKEYKFFASWECESSLKQPYRQHLPHPHFSIVLGWADIAIIGSPTSDGGIEQETVTEIIILPVSMAIKQLIAKGRDHLAAIYSLAAEHRQAWKNIR